MDGKELFRQAVRAIVDSTTTALTRAGLSAGDVDLFVPHQANERIISAACSRLGIGTDRVMSVLGHTGNTSAASIPLAMTEALDAGRVRPGDTVVMSGFGAGMSWASAVLHWS
jgi:3-oxoacyl-[acyl-carrier-protein] synthase-3